MNHESLAILKTVEPDNATKASCPFFHTLEAVSLYDLPASLSVIYDMDIQHARFFLYGYGYMIGLSCHRRL